MKLDSLMLATTNRSKIAEIENLLANYVKNFKHIGDLGLEPPVENGHSFEENALIKAKFYGNATKMTVLADDSGLCVEALDDYPGIYSADWSTKENGERDFAIGIEKIRQALLQKQKLESKELDNRMNNRVNNKAKFVCVLCLFDPSTQSETFFRGELHGRITFPPRGNNNFGMGYDPIFIPNDEHNPKSLTLAEMTPQQKNQISHRFVAMQKLVESFKIEC